MHDPRMTLELRPLQEGAYTQIRMSGPVVTVPSAKDMRRLMAVLTFWNGGPVHVVLSVAGTNADICWAELWDAVLHEVPSRHAEIRVEIRGTTPAAPVGHER
jgi:hypothetical protein